MPFVAEAAVASETPLAAAVPLVADSTSELTVTVTSGGKEQSTSFNMYAGTLVLTAGPAMSATTATPATFTVSRGTSEAATALPLTVNFTIGGTAVAGTDYEATTATSLTIPAGESEAQVVLKPLYNPAATEARTIVFTLGAGNYGGVGSDATVDVEVCTYAWYWDAENSTITDGDWVLKTDTVTGGIRVYGVTTAGTKGTLVNLREVTGLPQPIVEIRHGAFDGNTQIESLRLPDTLETIGYWAFHNCVYLSSVTPFLPDSVKSIGNAIFYKCPIENDLAIRNPAITSIEGYNNGCGCFQGIRSAHIDLSESSITAIGSGAFPDNDKLVSVKLPPAVASIGDWAFGNCTALQHVEPFLPDTLTKLGYAVFRNDPIEDDLFIRNPEFTQINWHNNGNGVFHNIRTKHVDLSESGLTAIGSYAFADDEELESVKLPSTVETIAEYAFGNCTSLVSFEPFLPVSLTSIGSCAFYKAPITNDLVYAGASLAIPNHSNGRGVFQGTKPQRIDFSAGGVTKIGSYAFHAVDTLTDLRLPASGLAEIGDLAFGYCYALTNVVPFLPTSLAAIGKCAFRDAPVANDLVLACPDLWMIPDDYGNWYGPFTGNRSKFIDLSGSSITNIGGNAFREQRYVTEVRLPTNLETISRNAFMDCTALKTLSPLLPKSLTAIGYSAFRNCPLEGDLEISNPNFTEISYGDGSWIGLFEDTRFKTADFSKSGLTKVGLRAFKDASNLTMLSFPATLTELTYQDFYDATALKEVIFRSYPATIDKETYSHVGAGDYLTRFLYPKDNQGWLDFMTAEGTTFVAWTDAGDAQATYNAEFPDGPTPSGYAKFYDRYVWLVPMADAGVVNLTVRGTPEDVGTVSPAYGFHASAAAATACTATLFGATEKIGYSNVCCVVEKAGASDWEVVETLPDALSYTLPADAEGDWRVTWQWQPVGYAVTSPESSAGSITASGTTVPGLAGFGDYFATGTVATVTAVPAAGSQFMRWYGDVPAGSETANPVSLAMDQSRNVIPYFESAAWTYDADAKTLSDGNWTFNVSASEGRLTISSVKSVAAKGRLNLRRPITGGTGGETVVKIGNNVFEKNTEITELLLPDTLEEIGACAFNGCTALARVEPFLPSSLLTIGWGAFAYCPVENDLTIDNPAFTYVPFTYNDCGVFRGIQSKTIDFSKSGIVTIDDGSVREAAVETLKLPETVERIGVVAFYECTSLKSVTPFLPHALKKIGYAAFYACPIENDLTIDNPEFTELPFCYNSLGTFSSMKGKNVDLSKSGLTKIGTSTFRNSSIEHLKLTECLTNIGDCAFYECSSLKTVEPFLPKSIEEIGSLAFYGCPIESDLVITSKDLTSLPDNYNGIGVFSDAHFKTVDLRKSAITTIGSYNFRYNSYLETVYMPKGLTYVGGDCLSDCSALKKVYWNDTDALTVHASAFGSHSTMTFIHFIPRSSAFWKTYLAESCTLVTPLSETEVKDYHKALPGEPDAKGKLKLASDTKAGYQFYRTWNPNPTFSVIVR